MKGNHLEWLYFLEFLDMGGWIENWVGLALCEKELKNV